LPVSHASKNASAVSFMPILHLQSRGGESYTAVVSSDERRREAEVGLKFQDGMSSLIILRRSV
jgi:hypothetical protein